MNQIFQKLGPSIFLALIILLVGISLYILGLKQNPNTSANTGLDDSATSSVSN